MIFSISGRHYVLFADGSQGARPLVCCFGLVANISQSTLPRRFLTSYVGNLCHPFLFTINVFFGPRRICYEEPGSRFLYGPVRDLW
jgi:hypothetical protein